jgi:hypothetical protein
MSFQKYNQQIKATGNKLVLFNFTSSARALFVRSRCGAIALGNPHESTND